MVTVLVRQAPSLRGTPSRACAPHGVKDSAVPIQLATAPAVCALAAAVGLLAVAAAASFLPALRVTRFNPAETLRQE